MVTAVPVGARVTVISFWMEVCGSTACTRWTVLPSMRASCTGSLSGE